MVGDDSDGSRPWLRRLVSGVGASWIALVAVALVLTLLADHTSLLETLPAWLSVPVMLFGCGVIGVLTYKVLSGHQRYLALTLVAVLGSAAMLLGIGLFTDAVRDQMGGMGAELAGAPSPQVQTDSAAPTARKMPEFPWPPPRASAMQVLPAVLLRDPVTLADVAQTLRATLDLAGRHELRFYAVPNGFAMVTRLESIDAQGNLIAEAERGVTGDFLVYIRNLFWVPPGRYRMVVFVVTDQVFAASGGPIDRAAAEAFMSGGFNDLPDTLGGRNYTAGYRTTALVYEFRKDTQDAVAQLLLPGQLDAHRHLEKIGWFAATAVIPSYAAVPVLYPEATASGITPR